MTFTVDGDVSETFQAEWEAVTDTGRRTWADLQEATEQGTYGIATLLVEELLGLTVVDRSVKGPGFDYYLGDPNDPDALFQNRMRLEVSGILTGATKIASRVKQKENQTKRSDVGGLPACVVVVEFGSPRARLTKR